MLWSVPMHCWFAKALSGPALPVLCPFAPCPTCKVDPSPLRGEEPERWRRLRQTGRLAAELEAAGLPARL